MPVPVPVPELVGLRSGDIDYLHYITYTTAVFLLTMIIRHEGVGKRDSTYHKYVLLHYQSTYIGVLLVVVVV